MPITVNDIKSYWNSSELRNITDYDNDGNIDDEVIQHSLDDAIKEIEAVKDSIPSGLIDIYTKKLTICNLLSRLNINPEAIELPLKDCKSVRSAIEGIIKSKSDAINKVNKSATGIKVSIGKTNLLNELDKY